MKLNIRNIMLASATCAVALQTVPAIAQNLPKGFYRQSNRPEVYNVLDGSYCHVTNESQMAAYGGFGKVKVVPVLMLRGKNLGECPFPSGYYRANMNSDVYKSYFLNNYCRVQNSGQMGTFGGFTQVKIFAGLRMTGKNTGDCPWPDGFYRISNRPEVYRLSGKGFMSDWGADICHVVNEQQMAAFGGFGKVTVLAPGSNIFQGRKAVMECSNPR